MSRPTLEPAEKKGCTLPPVRIEQGLEERVIEECNRTGESKGEVMRRALERLFEQEGKGEGCDSTTPQ